MTYECELPPIGELRLQHQTENWMLQLAKARSQYSNWELVEDWSLWYTAASSLKFGDWRSLVEDSCLYSRAWRSLCMLLWTCIVFTWNGCAFLLELQNLMLHWTSISLNWCVEVVLRVWCAIMNLEVEDIYCVQFFVDLKELRWLLTVGCNNSWDRWLVLFKTLYFVWSAS